MRKPTPPHLRPRRLTAILIAIAILFAPLRAAAADIPDISTVGSAQATKIQGADGTVLHLTAPNGNEQSGFEFDVTYPENKVISITVTGRINDIGAFTGAKIPVTATGRLFFMPQCPATVGDALKLSCTSTSYTLARSSNADKYAGAYDFSFTLTARAGNSSMASLTAGETTKLTIGSSTWILYSKKAVNTPNTDTEFPSGGPVAQGGQVILYMCGNPNVLVNRFLQGKLDTSEQSLYKDQIFWFKLTPKTPRKITARDPDYSDSIYLAYDENTTGKLGHQDDWIKSSKKVDADVTTWDKAKTALKPGQYSSSTLADGSIVLAVNNGPFMGKTAIQSNSVTGDPMTDRQLAREKAAGLMARGLYASTIVSVEHPEVQLAMDWQYNATGYADWYRSGTITTLPISGSGTGGHASFIDYQANGGTGGDTKDATGLVGDKKSIVANGFTWPDAGDGVLHTFTGWNTKPDGSGDPYAIGQEVTLPEGGLTLYAQWKASYKLAYDGNGGAGGLPAA